MARVESIGGLAHRQDVDVVGQGVVDRKPEAARVDRRPEPQMRDLVKRVDAGVRPPGASQLDHVATGIRYRALELAGHGARV